MDASSPPRTEPKLAVVVGATGNQGGSVARRFLREPGFRVRGLTRDTDSAASRQLAALGAEMVRVDLLHPEDDENENNDTSSLHAAFRGASVIFSVTSYWEPFAPGGTADDDDEKKKREAAGGESFSSVREYAGHAERTAGRNIADAAAATAGSLDEGGFVASTLSHAGRCSGGRVAALHHFDAKADVFPDYVRDRHPALAAKMKCVQTGFFMASHRILPDSYLAKLEDGSFEMRFCTDPAKPVPHLDPVADLGNFVYAVSRMPSRRGRDYMAEGTTCTWPEWIAAWSKATGVPARYRHISYDEMVHECGGEDFGGEIADMFEYTSNPGYDGGQSLLRARDLQEAGTECPMTSLEEWMGRQDWSSILSKPPTRKQ